MPIGKFREKWRVRRGIAQLSSPGGVGRLSYFQKLKNLFGSSIIGYWPGNEESGTVAIDYSGNGYNGTYTGVALGQEGVGDGLTSGLYDGANDYMLPPAGFRSALNGQLGSVLVWFAATDWTISGNLVNFFADPNNLIRISLNAGVTDRMEFSYIAGAVTKVLAEASGQTTTTFRHLGMTWSLVDDRMICYRGGVQLGTTQTGLGTFVGAFNATQTLIGAAITTPANVINGKVEHVAVLNRVATAAEMAASSAIV